MKALKWIGLSLLGLAALIVLGLIFVAMAVDPNRFKPQLEQLAERQDIDLTISGDLEWRFFPSLAIGIGSTSASGEDIPDIAFEQAYLQVAWGPLLRRDIAVKGITIDGLHLDLGESATSDDAVEATGGVPLALGTEQELGDGTRLAIENIRLTNSQIGYRDASGAQAYIRDIQFTANGFNTDGKAFPLELSMVLPEDIAGTPLQVDLKTQLRSDANFTDLGLERTRITANSLDPEEQLLRDIYAAFSATLDRNTDRAVVTNLELGLQTLRASGHLEAEQFSTDLRASGNFSVTEFDPRWLLAALDIDLDDLPETALRKISLATDFSASSERVSLRDLNFSLDDIIIQGGLDAGMTPRSLDLTLTGNRIDLRQYMAGSSDNKAVDSEDEAQASTNNPEQALLAPVAGALLWLDGGRGNITISAEQIITDVVTLEQPRLRLGANNNVLAINQIAAGAWEGQLGISGNIDFSHAQPAVRVQLEVTDVNLEQALTQLGDFEDLSGRGSVQFSGNTSGESSAALQRNLIGEGAFQLTRPHYQGFNVERAYCEMASLVEQRSLTRQEWPEGTQFLDLTGNFHVAGPRITLSNYESGIGNLAVRGRGRVNLQEENYEVLVNANLQAEVTSEQGCEVRSTRIRNRDIPIQCQGDFDGSTSCRPDEQFVQQLIRGQLEGLLRDKLLDRDDDDESDEESDAEAEDDPVRSLLRGVLGR